MATLTDEIKELFDQKSALVESSENKRRLNMWEPGFVPDEYDPGVIAPFPASKREEKRVAVTAHWSRIQWARYLKFDISDYYRDPSSFLKAHLEVDIYRFNHVQDDTPLLKTIPIYMSSAFEPSLFGVPAHYSSNNEPVFASDGAVIRETGDLSKLKMPDFSNSGLMPLAHSFYEYLESVVPEDYSVIFPKWARSPFGVACALRGMENLLADMLTDAPFVHALMRFVTDARKKYTRSRRKLLGRPDVEGSFHNDEVLCPLISPGMYEELIFPYEDELGEFHGGLTWWHSCGNKTPFIKQIKKISGSVGYMDLNLSNDDVLTAVRELDGKIPFHVRPTASDITESNESIIKNQVSGILCMCRGENFMFRLDFFQPDNPSDQDMDAMQRYISIARRSSEGFEARQSA